MGKILDIWAGDTVTHRGRRYFEINGELVADDRAVSGPPTLWQRLRRQLRNQPFLKPDPLTGLPSYIPFFRRFVPGLGIQGWEEALDAIIADGTQISNTTTETIVCPDFNIPAYYMQPGRVLRLYAFGVNSNVVTTPGTLILAVRWGGVAGTVLLQSAAQGLDTTARTNALWEMHAYIICRTAGSSGSFMSGGQMSQINLLSSTAANLLPAMLGSAGTPLASGNAAVTVDTTTAKLLSVTGKFSVATSPTNLTCQLRILEALN